MVSNIFRAKANELVESALALSKKLGCYESIISGIENGEIFSIEKGYKSKTIAYLEYIIFNFSTREIDSGALDSYSDERLFGYICDAYRILGNIERSDESINALIKKDRVRLAKKGAEAKLANDPRQDEKKTVRSHWEQWKKFPARYRSKADFARYMLKTCEHLTSQKKIEDWCREWEKEQQQA